MTYRIEPRKLVYMSLFVTLALALHFFESAIPVPYIVPGARLGLANIATVSALFLFSPAEVFAIVTMRVILASVFAGSMFSFVYSMAGAAVSLAVMLLLKIVSGRKIGLVGISCSGAVFHNLGQLLAASLIMKNIRIISYLPLMSVTGIITGVVIGTVSFFLIKSIRRVFVRDFPLSAR